MAYDVVIACSLGANAGYVLVGNELQSLLDGMGFDPYLGFFHQIDYGRPSLALDLLEEFRAALVARWSAGLLTFREWQYGTVRPPLAVLFGAVVVLLLIASCNIASLTLAHVTARRNLSGAVERPRLSNGDVSPISTWAPGSARLIAA